MGPVNGLEDAITARAQDQSVYVTAKWFEERSEQLRRENERVWRDQCLIWELILLFCEGKQMLRRSARGNSWRVVPLPERTDSPVYTLNLIGFYSENIKAKWTQSRTDIRWRPGSDRDETIGAAKAATRIAEHYERKLYTESFRQAEAMLAQCGKYARYYYYSDEADGGCGRREVYGTEQLGFGGGAFICADCGASGELPGSTGGVDSGIIEGGAGAGGDIPGGDASGSPGGVSDGLADGSEGLLPAIVGTEDGICPECGSPNIEVTQAEPLEVEALQGYEEVKQGDLVCEVVPLFELKHDIGMSPHESPYLIRTRRVRVSLLQAKFPWLKIRPAKSDDPGMRAAGQLRESSFTGRSAGLLKEHGAEEELVDFIQCWIDPCLYAEHVLKEDYRTLDGNVIPAGTKLSAVFPDGIYLCRAEGVEGVLEVRNESHKDYWVGGVYRPRAMSAMGSGIEDIVEGNRQYNLIMSLIYTQLRTAASPAILYEESLLPGGVTQYLGNPLKNIPVRTIGLPEQRRLQDAVHQLAPAPPAQQHFGYAQQLDFYMQKASRVTDFSGGLPGVNNETATGAQIASANSQSLFAPQLALKADVDRAGARLILKLFQKYCFDERYISLSGKRGEQDGVWLSAADVDYELFPEVVPESYLPQTNLERRERWEQFLLLIGGLPNLKMIQQEMPGVLEQIAEICDVDLGGEDYSTVAELCRERIEQMKTALPTLGVLMQGMPPTQMSVDPLSGQGMEVPVDPLAEAGSFLIGILQPPIELEELGHLAAIQYLRAWLTDDEGKKAPAELRAGVKAMIAAHLEGVIAEASLTGMVGMAGQPAPAAPEEQGGNLPKNQNPDSRQMKGGPKPQPKKEKERAPAAAVNA